MRKKIIILSLSCISFLPFFSRNVSTDTLETFFLKQINKRSEVFYAYYGLACIKFNQGNYKKAAQYAAKNLKKRNNFDTLSALLFARSLELSNRLVKAEKAYQKFYKLYPENIWIGYYYGFYLYKVRKYTQAEQIIEHTLRLNPFYTDAHYLLGYCLLEHKNNPECIRAFLFGLLTDKDTLRSMAVIRMINYYINSQFDSLHFNFFDRRLALKNVNDLLVPYLDNLNYFYQNFNPIYLVSHLNEKKINFHHPSLYSRFFEKLSREMLLEAFIFFALRNIESSDIKSWYKSNTELLKQLADFLQDNLNKPF